jgi:hypothetical protein
LEPFLRSSAFTNLCERSGERKERTGADLADFPQDLICLKQVRVFFFSSSKSVSGRWDGGRWVGDSLNQSPEQEDATKMEEIPTGSEEIICEQEEREVGLDLILTHDHLKTLIDKRTDEGSEERIRSEDGQREGRRGGRGRGRGREKEEEGGRGRLLT